jgi:hypothetical protein
MKIKKRTDSDSLLKDSLKAYSDSPKICSAALLNICPIGRFQDFPKILFSLITEDLSNLKNSRFSY